MVTEQLPEIEETEEVLATIETSLSRNKQSNAPNSASSQLSGS